MNFNNANNIDRNHGNGNPYSQQYGQPPTINMNDPVTKAIVSGVLSSMGNNMQSSSMLCPKPNARRSLAEQPTAMHRVYISKNVTHFHTALNGFNYPETLAMTYTACEHSNVDNICTVSVLHEHCIDIAKRYADVGMQSFTKYNNANPVVLNVIGKDYRHQEYDEEIHDHVINIRTSFSKSPLQSSIYVPLKNHYCLYTPQAYVIRPPDPDVSEFLPPNEMYRTAIISIAPIKQESADIEKFSSQDFINTCTNIECVFQTAISWSHYVLILPPFGLEDNNPLEDTIKIYNYCIMKYGHKFKEIVIAVPPHYPKNVVKMFQDLLIKPNELCKHIDDKYAQIADEQMMQAKLREKLAARVPVLNNGAKKTIPRSNKK